MKLVCSFAVMMLVGCAARAGTKVSLNEDRVLVIDGKKFFPIGFTMAPPPDGKTPSGKSGLQELRDAGGNCFRTGPTKEDSWDEKGIATEQKWLDAAAKHRMYCFPWLKELSSIPEADAKKEQQLRAVIKRFKDHPGLGAWKGADEPDWGKHPIPPLELARQIIREEDPNHPVWIVQAPQGTVDSMRRYTNTMDITGQDVYPVAFPPGGHSNLPNPEISLVGDHTRLMMDVAQGRQAVWMTLQISWSGVIKEGRQLTFPTFTQERFMAYQAIINGARGLIFFGGSNVEAMSERDAKLGWNWTFWDNVLKRVVEEFGEQSPLAPALVAPEAKNEIVVKQIGTEFAKAKQIEFCVREVGDDLYLLACQRGGDALQVKFQGVAAEDGDAEVMFESPRKVKIEKGVFNDWFAPFDVHVYKFARKN